MKCNPDAEIMRIMKERSLGFDCASKKELMSVVNMGINPNRIIFAHPCKKLSDIAFAKQIGVAYSVFDSSDELEKIHSCYKDMKVILRIRIQNDKARVQLGKKYGANEEEWDSLLHLAANLGLEVHGISFHVGSASNDPEIFDVALNKVQQVIQLNRNRHPMHIVDIGGGFQKSNFIESADVIRKSIKHNFANNKNIQFIAEPGRFFVEDSSTFFTSIIGKRRRPNGGQEYWISDGLYGSMNCILYDKHVPNYSVLRYTSHSNTNKEEEEKADVWGSTCDSMDKVLSSANFPKHLKLGDFIRFDNFGAYTLSGACDFNGINFTNPAIFYIKNNNVIC
jgi:ornithine decarboxylase